MKILEPQQIKDILMGCTLLGTGGGGDFSEGWALIEQALEQQKVFRLAHISEVADQALLCTPYLLGALLVSEDNHSYYKPPHTPPILEAYKRLESYFSSSIKGTVCCELGGANTAVALYLAAITDGFTLDADPAGRAVPECIHSTYYLNGLPAAPIFMANNRGETFIAEHLQDDSRAEHVIRALAIASDNDIAVIDHVLPAQQLKSALISGTLSQAQQLGEVINSVPSDNHYLIERLLEIGHGQLRFIGLVASAIFNIENGFTVGEVVLMGQQSFLVDQYKIQIKNENMCAFLNGQLDACIPDLICCLDMDTGLPICNPHLHQGMNIAVMTFPAPTAFTSERGMHIFGPAYLSLDDE